MGENLNEVDPIALQEEGTSAKNKAIFYTCIIVGVLLTIVIIFWLALRLNYKVTTVRDSFWPAIKWIAIVIIGFIILVAILMFLLNILGKKGEYDKHFVDEKELEKKSSAKKN